uniref:G-protein coupled receptors family 1 profile domain-containing protein n=1 Tax=Peromyscus maniculatus bairdii TaxID=230844 RepID=A0A8C8UKW9_PERMB
LSGHFLSVNSNTPDWGTNITAVNGSNYTGLSFCEILSCTMLFLSLIIALVGVVGNAIVLWFLGFHMHRNAFSVYILNLAWADFFFLCFQIVYCIHIILYIFNAKTIDMPLFSFVLSNSAYLCGLSILSAISFERSLSVMCPIWYCCQRLRHTSAVICTLLWFLSLLLSLLEGKECGLLFDSLDHGWCQAFDFITAAWIIVLFMVLLGSSLAFIVTIFCGSQRIPVTRLYVTIVCTVLFFLLFACIDNFQFVVLCNFYPVTICLSCFNSCANPIIYFLVGSIRNRKFQRNTIKLLLQRAMQDTPVEEQSGEGDSSGRSREMKPVSSCS